MPNLFLNKYTCYNSWVFFYKENTNTSNDLQILKLIYDTDFEDIPKKKLKKNEMKTKSMNIPLVEKNNIKFIFKRKEKTDYEKALAPKYVQMVADMSSILSFYHILNIMKSVIFISFVYKFRIFAFVFQTTTYIYIYIYI